MSKKKKLQQQQLEQEMLRAREESEKRNARRMSVAYTIVNPRGIPLAVAKPAAHIQLTPIVQPIAMVPYSTQQQPILSDSPESDDYDF